MAENTEQNRSEQPTAHKLKKGREKGSIARGMDLGFLTALAAFLGYLWVTGPALAVRISRSAEQALVMAPQVLDSPNAILAVTGGVLLEVAKPLAFMSAVIFLVVLVFEVIQTGVIFTAEPLRPDFSRLSPAKGFKRVFSIRMLVETGKNILKMGVYVTITYLVIRHAMKADIAAVADARGLTTALHQTGLKLLGFFLLGAILFAIFDQMIVRREFLKQMRMSRREVKRESRDREGEPRMKQRRKQLHAEFVKLSESLRNIRGADVLITNPSHFAVALKYVPEAMAAPVIVSRGSHQFAQRLKRLAFVYGVVIVQNPPLARALYRLGEINGPVPEALYQQVADIYLDMRRKSGSQQSKTPDV